MNTQFILGNLGQKIFGSAVCFGISVIAVLPVQADEVWSSDYGTVVYQKERGTTAIWTYGEKARGTLFIDNLAGQFKDRGTYYGYWSQTTSKVRCQTYREGRDGQSTYYWGNFHIQFLDTAFPARWSARIGYCNQPAKLPWQAYPIVGDSVVTPLQLP